MKSKPATPRVLLDTSFLLPSLGIDVEGDVAKGLKALAGAQAEIYFSLFSILESLWVAGKFVRSATFDRDRFSLGLRSIIEGGKYRKVEADSQVFDDALSLLMLGHKDMVDNILYASSSRFNLRFLTLDSELKEFIRARGLTDILISPEELAD